MPYRLVPLKSGFVAESTESHKRLSKRPMTKEKARKQIIAVALAESRKTGKPVKSFF